MSMSIECKRRTWVLKIGYDERYANASPGLLLLAESISDSARCGIESYEFLGQREKGIEPWTREVRACVNIAAYPLGVWSTACCCAMRLAI